MKTHPVIVYGGVCSSFVSISVPDDNMHADYEAGCNTMYWSDTR